MPLMNSLLGKCRFKGGHRQNYRGHENQLMHGPVPLALETQERDFDAAPPFRRKRRAPKQPSKRCLSGQDGRRALEPIDLFDHNVIEPGGATRTKNGCNPLNREL
jgi:hypothetical protein